MICLSHLADVHKGSLQIPIPHLRYNLSYTPNLPSLVSVAYRSALRREL